MDWDRAYRDHQPEVFAYLYTRCGRSRELARDLAQDVFVRAMRYEGRFRYDDGRGVAPWLMTIARNLLVDHFKRHSTQREHTVDAFHDDWSPPMPSAEMLVLDQAEADQAMAAVLKLCAAQRTAMLLTFSEVPDAQIAQQLGSTTGAVKTLKFRARATLRRELAEVA